MAREKLCRNISVGFQIKKSLFSFKKWFRLLRKPRGAWKSMHIWRMTSFKMVQKKQAVGEKISEKVTLETTGHPINEVRSSLTNATRAGRKSRIGKKLPSNCAQTRAENRADVEEPNFIYFSKTKTKNYIFKRKEKNKLFSWNSILFLFEN